MSRTTIRMRVLPRFPARITGTNGVTTERADADLIIKNDFSTMIRVPAIDDPAKIFLLVWNVDLNTYSIMSFTDTFSAAIDVNGLMDAAVYDPQGRKADIFAALDSLNTRVNLAAWEKVGAYTLNAASLLDVTNLSAYSKLRITGTLTMSASANVVLRFSTNNGTTFDSANNYPEQALYAIGSTVGAVLTNLGGAALFAAGVDANFICSVNTSIECFNKASRATLTSGGSTTASGALTAGIIDAQYLGTTARNAIRILPLSGTMTGNLLIEGVRG